MNSKPGRSAKDWEEELDGIGRAVLRHLKKNQPNLHHHLVSRGELKSYVLNVQEQAGIYLEKADNAGRPPEETEEVIRETWISRPDVDEEPKEPPTRDHEGAI